jgi:hypothetical protein
MPTLNWILETAEERFYERGGDEIERSPSRLPCPMCDIEFADPVALSWHVSDAHPLERPLLLVDGNPAPSSAVYSRPLDPTAILCANTTSIRVTCNGQALADPRPSDLAARLASERQAVFQIELENSRAEDDAKIKASYAISTSVPDPQELEAVDRLFADHLVVENPTLSEIRTFADAAARYSSADRYSDGLAAYVLGVLVKEGDAGGGATLPFDAFQAKMQRALAELAPHRDRPIAQAVCATVQLNVNDVREPIPLAGDPALVGTLTWLQRLANGDLATPDPSLLDGNSLIPVCPIDRDTHLVLRAYEDLRVRGVAPNSTTVREYAARAEDSTLSAFDRTKLHAMLAAHLLVAGDDSGADPHLNALIHDPVFGGWAQSNLDHHH